MASPLSSFHSLYAKFPVPCATTCNHSHSRTKVYVEHQQQASCIMTTDAGSVRKLLQVNGTVEDTVTFSACSTSSSSSPTSQYEFTYSSSSRQVLSGPTETTNSNTPVELNIVEALPCTNVSVFLTFDALVGITIFSLIARDPVSRNQICSESIEYVIVGISVYEAVSSISAYTNQSGQPGQLQTFGASVRQRAPILSDASDGVLYVLHSGVENPTIFEYIDSVQSTTREFSFRAQFPDGSDSSTKPSSFVSQILQSLTTRVNVDATSPVQFDGSTCPLVRTKLFEAFELESTCGIAIAVSQDLPPVFGVRFVPYKDGASNFLFSWPSLTVGDDILEDDVYENVIVFQVVGDPPPIVESIAVPDILYRAGGQRITLVIDNSEGSASRVLRVGELQFPEIDGSYRRLENGLYEAAFESVAGNGTELPYTIELEYDEDRIAFSKVSSDSVQTRLSYTTIPLNIRSINPLWGEDSETVILQGFFDMFDSARSGHNLYIGEKSILELGIQPTFNRDLGTISFDVPPRGAIGSAYVYPIQIVVNLEVTNVVSFSYIPGNLTAKIDVLGGSLDVESDIFLVGVCENTHYSLRLPSGSMEPDVVLWTLRRKLEERPAGSESNLFTMFPDISIRGISVLVPSSVFAEMVGSFVIEVECEVYGRLLNASVVIQTTGIPVIGVDLPLISTRSIGLPNLPARVNAIVTVPDNDCYSLESSIVYEWTYGDIRRNFSSDDPPIDTDENDVRPGRLGRELVIPQSKLRYGVFSILLSVYVKDNPLIFGSATTTLIVKQADPVAVIGSGALRIYHGAGSDLFVRGDGSYIPDTSFVPNATIEWYSWSCEMSAAVGNGSTSSTCPETFLPRGVASNFIVPSSTLLRTKEQLVPGDETSSFRIIYSLRVGTSLARSPISTQSVEVIPTLKKVPTIFQVDLLTGRGTTVNWRRVRFYDELVIAPRGTDVNWTFSVLSPAIDAELFKLPMNLLKYDGYYNPMKNSPQPYPLGVKAYTLRPAQTYKIGITLYASNETDVTGLTVVQLETVDRPRLVLPPLILVKGNISTVFSASAKVNLDSNSHFFFFFFLVRRDGQEICVDGCSGRSTVQFRVLEVGSFRLLAKLRDVEGSSILDEKFFVSNITVLQNNETSASQSGDDELFKFLGPWLRDAYRIGDHGAVEQISSTLARIVQSMRKDELPGNTTAELAMSLSLMHKVALNSVPNTLTARSYIQTLNQFARLDPFTLPDAESVVFLVATVDETLSRVPVAEALNVLPDLLLFYNLTTRHVLHPFAGTYLSSRMALARRVRAKPYPEFSHNLGADSFAAITMKERQFLVDFFTMLQKHLSLVLSRDAVCGAVEAVNTSVPGGIGSVSATEGNGSTSANEYHMSSFISSFEQYKIPVWSTFSLGVVCNPFEVNRIVGHKSWFSWCNEFTITQDEGFFTSLQESPSPEFLVNTLEPSVAQLPFIQELVMQQQGTNAVPSPVHTATNLAKRLYIMLETMDYTWLSGLVGDDVRTMASYLLTINALYLNGNDFFLLSSPTKSCYNLNTSVPKLGRTEGGGCLGVKGFTVDVGINVDDKATKKLWQMTRSFNYIRATLSTDGSSSLLLEPEEPQIVGAVLDFCPADVEKPEVELPEKIDQFSYIIIGTAVGASTIVTLTWIGTSAQYATFTGATVVVL